MFVSSWLRQLHRRWYGRRPTRPVRRRQYGRPRLEALEDRTLLSAPAEVTVGSLTGSAGQFQGFTDLSATKFLGTDFNVNGGFGSFTNGWGLGANLNVQGKVGFDASYDVSGGNVSATYNNLALSQNYVEPTQFGQQVTFTPQNTNVSYGTGTFSTTSPQAGAGLALDAGINGSISGGLELAGKMLGGSTTFSGSVNQSLISYDTINGLEVLGKPLSSLFSAGGGNTTATVGVSPYGEVELPVEIAPGISLKLGITQANNYTGLKEDLSLAAGVEGEGNVPSIDGAIELGSATEQLPNITLSSNSLQSGNTLSDTEESSVASLDLQMGPLVASLLGFPEAGALVSTDTITIGPITLSITPISFTLGPDVKFVQTGTITPTNSLTYNFTDSSGNTLNVDVTKDGADLGPVSSVTFTPGTDNLGIKFDGTPITVTPTWTTGLNYTNEIDLDVDLQGTLTVLELTGSASLGALSGSFTLGPLYQHTWDFHDWKLATVYDNTFSIASQTQTLTPFTIGDTFHPDLTVTTTQDTGLKGSLRYAVESANVLGANSSTPEVIQLGPGTYNLTIGPTGTDDGSSGDLNVTGENIIIQGAGAGQTIINAAGLGDRIFDVNSGAGLTLQGVTLENGSTSETGGAISNAGTLNITNSTLDHNTADSGGAIYNSGAGTVNITHSTLEANSATHDNGGAILNEGTLNIADSTLDGNSATLGSGGAVYETLNYKPVTITNSTLVGNTAYNAGGALVIFSFSSTNLINDTITRNRANSSGAISNSSLGGGIYVTGGSAPYLGNTIVTDNYNGSTGTTEDDIFGTVDSTSSHNLIGTGGSGGLTNGNNGNLVGDDNAGLGTFGNHGGPTQTVQLLPGSLAIDAGSNALAAQYGLTTDQRGYSRVVNGNVDIGAVEYQYDLALFGYVAPGHIYSTVPNTVAYLFILNNNGPDSVAGATLTVPLPTGTVFESVHSLPSGWTETDPGVGNNGTVTITDTNNYNSGGNESFEITAQVQNTAAGTNLSTTATAGSTFWDNNQQNNSVTLSVINEQEGQPFDKVPLFHFTDPNPSVTPSDFTASVGWGDGNSNTSSDGLGAVSVAADPNGGFDVLGSHTFAEEGEYSDTVSVTGLDGTKYGLTPFFGITQQLFVVTDAPLTAGALTPPPNATINQPISNPSLTNTVLYHFTDAANPNATANDFTATVNWGDGNSNTSSDGTGNVSVVADPNGGFNVVGISHNYAKPGSFGISVSITGSDGTTYNQPSAFTFKNGALLFHFTDANPNATVSDFSATVNWGDSSSNTSSDGTGNVFVVANPSGGFDVYGLHTYTQIVNPGTFTVTVNDVGGASTSASATNFQVLNPDQPLTAGALNVPSVTTEGQSISNQVLFHFTDADPNAQASDYLAAVSWGDGTFNNSSDGSNSVSVVANPNGGFDVVGSHTYSEGGSYFAVKVTDLGDPRSSTPDAGGQVVSAGSSTLLNITDPAVTVTASSTAFSASESSMSTVQTLATFTDPGGPESDANAYVAIVQWGDGSVTATNLTAQAYYAQATVNSQGQISGQVVSASNVAGIVLGSDGKTFSVNLAHQYAEEGQYTITILINHDGVLSPSVTTTAAVADPAVLVTAGKLFSATEGITSSVQTVATFTDPGGPESDPNAYTATVDWGDGTTNSVATLANGGIVLGSDGKTFSVNLAHMYTDEGTYAITITLDHEGAQSTPVTITANVADNDNLTATGTTLTGTYSTALTNVTLATFSDTYTGNSASDFVATVNWGDGSSTTSSDGSGTVSISGSSGNFTVTGSHNYGAANTTGYPISVTISDDGAGTATATASTTAIINPLAMSLNGSRTYDGTNTAAASILTITNLVSGDNVTLSGNATLASADAGSETITDFSGLTLEGASAGNYTLTGASGSVTITAATLSVTPVNISPIAGAPTSGPVATITNNVDPKNGGDYTVVINWGDGTPTSSGTISGSGSTLTISGTHTYAAPNSYTVTVTISNNQRNATPVTITESITVANLNQRVVEGLTGTIGFWHNKHGQALIDSFNGGPNSTALANWLATTFPNLYGNLAGDTNAQVAAYFQTLFSHHCGPKAQAQTLAVALNVYATTLSLGGTVGAAYGFTVSAAGLGAYSFNVGRDGAAFGVPNHTTLNVYQLLLAVNNKAVKGVLYKGAEVADLFGKLNEAGDLC